MVRLLVATVYLRKSNITLLPCFFLMISYFDYYTTLGYYFLPGAQVLHSVFPYLIYIIS